MKQLQETTTALTAALQSEQQAKTEALNRLGSLTQVQIGSVYESAQFTNWLTTDLVCACEQACATDCASLLLLALSTLAQPSSVFFHVAAVCSVRELLLLCIRCTCSKCFSESDGIVAVQRGVLCAYIHLYTEECTP
jgi:hypothetical protein